MEQWLCCKPNTSRYVNVYQQYLRDCDNKWSYVIKPDKGNLGVEAVNSSIERLRFHRAAQSLKTAYQRCDLMCLNANLLKVVYWRATLQAKHPTIYGQMAEIYDDVKRLKKLPMASVLRIAPKPQLLKQMTTQRACSDMLVFDTRYAVWNNATNLELWLYLNDQPNSFALNAQTLQELFEYFEGRYSPRRLRRQCAEFDIFYCDKDTDWYFVWECVNIWWCCISNIW